METPVELTQYQKIIFGVITMITRNNTTNRTQLKKNEVPWSNEVMGKDATQNKYKRQDKKKID